MTKDELAKEAYRRADLWCTWVFERSHYDAVKHDHDTRKWSRPTQLVEWVQDRCEAAHRAYRAAHQDAYELGYKDGLAEAQKLVGEA